MDDSAILEVVDSISPRVTEQMNQDLLADVSVEEVRAALFQMHPSKVPGPDGLSPIFFQKFWDVVGKDVVEAVRAFSLLRQLCFTNVVLIPKVKTMTNMTQLRPISLCNVLYKIGVKVLANRLKIFLPQIISPWQSAFVLGRIISDNSLVAAKVAHFLHNKRCGCEGAFALKLDMSKA